VAASITPDTFDMFLLMHRAGQAGYECMRKCKDVHQLRKLVQLTGAEAGGGKCVWAESFALQIVSTKLGITLLILDEEVRGRNNPNRFVTIKPECSEREGRTAENKLMVVVLQRTRRSHYNLIVRGDTTVFDCDDFWPPLSSQARMIKQKTEHAANADGEPS
jgi:hypothetical protein